MRKLVAIFFLTIVAIVLAAEDEPDGEVSANGVDAFMERVRNSLESVRSLFRRLEKHEFPSLHLPQIKAEDLQLSANIGYIKINGASDFIISVNESIYEDQAVKFTVWFPELTIQGQYGASGVLNKETFYGQGTFWLVFSLIQIHARAVLGGSKGFTEVTDVEFSYRIHDVKFNSNGLRGVTSSNEQINSQISDNLVKIASDYNQMMATKIGTTLKSIANAYLTGRGLSKVRQELKNYSKVIAKYTNFSFF